MIIINCFDFVSIIVSVTVFAYGFVVKYLMCYKLFGEKECNSMRGVLFILKI